MSLRIDDELLEAVDQTRKQLNSQGLNLSRSGFTRFALTRLIRKLQNENIEIEEFLARK